MKVLHVGLKAHLALITRTLQSRVQDAIHFGPKNRGNQAAIQGNVLATRRHI